MCIFNCRRHETSITLQSTYANRFYYSSSARLIIMMYRTKRALPWKKCPHELFKGLRNFRKAILVLFSFIYVFFYMLSFRVSVGFVIDHPVRFLHANNSPNPVIVELRIRINGFLCFNCRFDLAVNSIHHRQD